MGLIYPPKSGLASSCFKELFSYFTGEEGSFDLKIVMSSLAIVTNL
jgi:hypothetical protein